MTSSLQIRTQAIDGLEAVARELRAVEAKRFDLLARGYRPIPSGEMSLRSYRAEAALALGVTERRVDTMLGLAAMLSSDYHDTASLLRAGQIDVAHAEIITTAGLVITNVVATGVDEAARAADAEKVILAAARRKEYEHAVLVYALEETPNRLRPIAKRLAEQWAVESIEARQAAETVHRRVSVVEMSDGMAELRVYMPALQAYGLHDHLTRIAKAVKRKTVPAPTLLFPPRGVLAANSPGDGADAEDTRGLDEIRVDALHDLLARDPFDTAETAPRPTGAELQGRVQLVVTAEGLDELLAKHGGTVVRDTAAPTEGAVKCELQGYGPVSIDAARPLIASRQLWDLITVCSHTGEVIRTDGYRPVKPQERFLVARDGHCRFPGCIAPTYRSEIDHTIDAALGGPTATDNLAHLCLKHHILKGNSDWKVEQGEGGVLVWTSPTGKTHVDRPPDRLPEHRMKSASQRSPVRFEPAGDGEHPF